MRDILPHIFLPHHTNNHKAKFLHHSSLFTIVCLVLFSSLVVAISNNRYQEVLGISSNISTSELLVLTNEKRQEEGLAPLALNEKLSNAASEKAKDMIAKNYWAHNSPDGTTPWVFVRSSGYDYLYAGENLARGFVSSSEIVDAWMDSPGHRENILSGNYSDVGFAILDGELTGDETVLVVQMFGKTKSLAPEIAEAQVSLPVQNQESVAVVPDEESLVAQAPQPAVASVQSAPLIDSQIFSKTSSYLILGLLIGLLVLDAVIVKRKKIVRILSHNLDHVMFLFVVLIVILIIGNGTIL